MKITSAEFVTSAHNLTQCPDSDYPEFAFIGRSNVGKSALINMLTQRKRLAKSSRTPGKTQLVNFFLVNQQYMLVDLPGYGYAKSARSERGKWTDRSMNYFLQRPSLLQVFVLVDGSIPVQKIDKEFIAYLHQQGVSFSIIVTKTDKAKQKDLNVFVKSLQSLLSSELPIFLTSSEKKKGWDSVWDHIESMVDRQPIEESEVE